MSDANRGTKRQAPTESFSHSETNDNLSQDDILSLPGTSVFDETFSQVSRGKRKRKRFNTARRKEVAKVRKVGACEECRTRKVACKHALQGTDNLDSAPTPKPSPQRYPFDFEATYPNPAYPKTILDDGVGQTLHMDRSQLQDLSIDEGSELIATVKGLTGRQARLIDEIHDFNNIIEDNSGCSRIKSKPDLSEWGQHSPWMESAMALTNNHQSPQPSTAYLYSNFSTNPRLSSSTPASSHTNLLSPSTNEATYCRCNTYLCDHSHRLEQVELFGRHHESEQAETHSSTKTYPCPLDCGTNSFRRLKNLHTHMNHNHSDVSSRQTQLLPSSVSKLDTQLNSMAHINRFFDEYYLPGIEENPIAVTDQRPSQINDRLSIENWGAQNTSSRAQNIRRSNSPMHSQLSTGILGGTTNVFELQFGNASSGLGNNSNALSPNTSPQQAPYRSQSTIGEMSSFNGQHRKRHSHPPLTNSPTMSWTGQFARDIDISDQMDVRRVSSNIQESTLSAGMQTNNRETLTTVDTTSHTVFPNLHRNWSPLASGFSQQNFTSYNNAGYSQSEANLQPENDDAGAGLPPWSGTGSPLTMIHPGGADNDYTLPGFQPDDPGTEYGLRDVSLLPNYPVSSETTKNPMIMLNNRTMLYGGQDPAFNLALNSLDSDPLLSQRHSVPYLDHGTLSSSGASESLVSPIDAPNSFNNNLGDEWDITSNFYNDFSNMDVNTTDEAK